ncbi:MAG: general secretion pathway protein [Gammaproteobacteria bacterium]|jgi:general secretion pathway protein M|nr:general secretion pathway protein [Gammaproteobacteria bacterium]
MNGITRLPRSQRRILAVLLLVLVVLLAVRLILVPVWATYAGNRDAIAQYQDDIARYSRLSSQVAELQSAVGELQASDDLVRFVLPQESEPLAAAALQARVKSVVTDSGGTLTSTQVLPTEPEQGFKRIIVNVRMAGSTDALQRVLFELENGLPYLIADDIVILSRAGGKRRRAAVPVDRLDVRFNLNGYMRDTGGPA